MNKVKNLNDIRKDDLNHLEDYLRTILEVNKTINLTNITDISEATLLHLEDSVSVLTYINDAPIGKYADIGTGGGFPGVPLGMLTGRQTFLIDSVEKKLKAVDKALDIVGNRDNISTYWGRIEEISKKQPREYSVITARALSSLPSLLELAAPLLNKGGRLIAMKSRREEDIDNDLAEEKLGMRFISYDEYYLSDGETFRSVYVYEKVSDPKVKLPRKTGLAQKRPLLGKK